MLSELLIKMWVISLTEIEQHRMIYLFVRSVK